MKNTEATKTIESKLYGTLTREQGHRNPPQPPGCPEGSQLLERDAEGRMDRRGQDQVSKWNRPMRRYDPGYSADADAGPDHYYAVVKIAGQVVSNCLHRHLTRQAAERCSVRLLASVRTPR